MLRVVWLAALMSMLSSAGCGGDVSDLCAADDPQAVLDGAPTGATFDLGACSVAGPLIIPPGVAVRGAGLDSVITAAEGTVGVVFGGGAPAGTVDNVRVVAGGRVGVLVPTGAAGFLSRVTVEVIQGVGIGAGVGAEVTLDQVTVRGPITADNADDSRWLRVVPMAPAAGECPAGTTCDCTPGDVDPADDGRVCDAFGRWAVVTAAYGLYLDGADATLTDVSIEGIAEFGAAFVESSVSWTGGSVEQVLGVGVRQIGGALTLNDVAIEDIQQGVRGQPVYGVAATGAELTGHGLTLRDCDRYGLFVEGGRALLMDLLAERNGDAAVWVSDVTTFELRGESLLADNDFAGIVVQGSDAVAIEGASIRGTLASTRSLGALGAVRIGDGLHVIDPPMALDVLGVTFTNNERVGALFDLGPAGMGEGMTFVDVTVTGEGAELGAVAGRIDVDGRLSPILPGGWDTGITRAGAALANDTSVATDLDAVTDSNAPPSPLERVGAIAPMF